MSSQSLHVAIIPDGNRRWARQRSLQPWLGHEEAMRNSRALIDWCRNNPDIGTLTLWGFSTENWNRSEAEVTHLMRIYEEWLKGERDELISKRTHFVHSGRSERIPKSLADAITDLAQVTKDFDEFTLNFALDYGGRDELIRAINKIEKPSEITEENFRDYFDHPELSDIDLVIRTSGEKRSSGFFIWQAAYAEWYYEPKLFPDLTPADLEQALGEYCQRQRRFGK